VKTETTAGGSVAPALRCGCYALCYTPVGPLPGTVLNGHYDGTFRVTAAAGGVAASGDLYEHAPPAGDGHPTAGWVWPWREFRPDEGIPVFPIAAYRYYLRVISLRARSADRFRLRFELHEFDRAAGRWDNRGFFTAGLRRTRGPRGYPSRDDFLTGEVRDASGATAGFLSLGWLSESLRRMTVEIDRAPDSEFPLDNGGAEDWRTVFGRAGWQVEVVRGDEAVAEPADGSWSDAELHAAMERWRDPGADLDREWRYHLLCVRRVDAAEWGVTYDWRAADSNHVPREGSAVASHWVFPDVPKWGRVRGQRYGSADAPYFRTALHEVGHALNLDHNGTGVHVMRQTGGVAEAARPPVEFPDNIDWAFSPADTLWLRHAADPLVRPGGVKFVAYGRGPSLELLEDRPVRRAAGLTLQVVAWLDAVPLGAPVRVHAVLTNTGTKPVTAPAELSFRAGSVAGRVTDSAGRGRSFRPLVLCADAHHVAELPPGGRVEQSFTLLRGPEGALFPSPGEYHVAVAAEWEDGEARLNCEGGCTVAVTDVRDAAHAAAARKLLGTPDALLTLVLAGDHLPEGRAAVRAGLDDEVLRPHYAAVEARRLARRFRDRPADLAGARRVLDESSVLTPSEIRRLSQLAASAPGAPADLKEPLLAGLKAHAARVPVGAELLQHLA
jgi:hypothetical protein